MAEKDAMQVDTTPSTSGPSPETVIQAMLLLLRDALHSFVTMQITRTLGKEMLSAFAPKSTANEIDLLIFIDRKWLAIFSDSPLSAHQHTIRRLLPLTRSARNSPSTHAEIARLVEALLMSIAPTRAARAADLRRWVPAVASSASRVSSSTRAILDATASAPALRPLPPSPASSMDGPSDVKHGGVLMPVVLDGSNIAWRHGRSSHFSMRGALLALRYYAQHVSDVALFLPEARLDPQHRDADIASYDEIQALHGSRHLVLTPSNDYDDAYMCSFARKHAAAIVSNDEFRDHIYQASADGEGSEREWKEWIQSCRVSFTFCKDEFVPYPAFNWIKASNVATRLRFS